VGQFQTADGGTLFLDEIADLSLTAQAKILRVLQEQMVERVGGRSPMRVDVRVLAASNKDLETEIRKGNFREDLYYRLKVIQIHMPALREIREDIPVLANHFLAECCREAKREPLEFGPGVLDRLREAPWPGNVRQLHNEVKRVVACARRQMITVDELWDVPAQESQPTAHAPGTTLKSAIERLERQMIAETLSATGGNQMQTAKALGLSRQGLLNKMGRYGLR
jgi:DNA-binding NtrC family response regulator